MDIYVCAKELKHFFSKPTLYPCLLKIMEWNVTIKQLTSVMIMRFFSMFPKESLVVLYIPCVVVTLDATVTISDVDVRDLVTA